MTDHQAHLVRILICSCGWRASSVDVPSLDDAFREHRLAELLWAESKKKRQLMVLK